MLLLCESIAVRAVALLGPIAKEHHIRQFDWPGVDIFSGNELDPSDRPDAVLIFGGDGTIHRHLGALALTNIPVLVVPLGSANDFAASLGNDTVEKALRAWHSFCATGDNTRRIDLGTVSFLETGDPVIPVNPEISAEARISAEAVIPETSSWQGESLETLHFVPLGPRLDLPKLAPRIMHSQLRRAPEFIAPSPRIYFGCIAGTGLDAAVNRLTLQQPRWLRSHGGYVVALFQVLAGFRPPRVTLSVKLDERWEIRIDESGFLVAAGNGPQYGHGMRLTDKAEMDDGLLDVCFVRLLSKMRLLRLFRVVYRGGHIGMKEVEYFRATRVRLTTEPVSEVFADGEYLGHTPVELSVEREALRVIVNL